MHYSTDNNVPQESELPKWSSRACENVEIKESGEHCMSKEGYCLWFEKFIRDFSEHESETCMNECIEYCDACECFTERDRDD